MSDDFRSTASPETLAQRAAWLRRTRSFFDDRGFVEVQTPLLSADTVVDRHLDPIPVLVPEDPWDLGSGRAMYLQTSPEFLMKRLLASGMTAIYQIGPAFRIGETGEQHNPEFTMLEWYRCGDDLQAGMQLLSDFAAAMLDRPAAKIQSMRSAFQEIAGFDPYLESAEQLQSRCQTAAIAVPDSIPSDDWDSWFEILLATTVQPQLGHDEPHILHDFPASQAALAQVCSGKPPVAERFELFVDSVELANGYHELLDPIELLSRNASVNRLRVGDGKSTLPEQSRLVRAMESGLPTCSGVAVGFDRLVMLATENHDIRSVISFPIDRA